MIIFKDKGKKRENVHINIDNKHQEIIKNLECQKNYLNNMRTKLDELNINFNNLVSIPNNLITDEQIQLKFQIKCDIDEIEKTIDRIENDESSKQYFIHTGHLLFNYYNKMNQNDEGAEYDKKNPLSKSILDYFNLGEDKTKSNEIKVPIPEKKKTMTKSQMLDKYMSYVDSRCISDKDKEDDIEVCKMCNQQKLFIHTEGQMVCQKCGEQDYVFIDCDKPSYKEPPKEIAYFAYKRINHFNEHISQFQGKESTEIKPEIYKMIEMELKKDRITDLSTLTCQKIREILRKLNLNKYYEHIPHIINHLNGIPPPNITKSQEETLRVMFKEIQIPFMKYCPPDRQNFSSYPYILHKFCELLEWDHLLPCFPLLKSREKLQEADETWEKICNDLGWEFYKSI